MKKKLLLVVGIVVLLLAGLGFAALQCIGVSTKALANDAQKKLGVDKSWSCYSANNQNLAVVLFFDDKQEAYDCAVYVKKDGLRLGYFYLDRVSDPAMAEGALAISYEGEVVALVSLNKQRVARIETEGQTWTRNPDSPIVHMLPLNAGRVTLYDEGGQVVPLEAVQVG